MTDSWEERGFHDDLLARFFFIEQLATDSTDFELATNHLGEFCVTARDGLNRPIKGTFAPDSATARIAERLGYVFVLVSPETAVEPR